ncbi:MAG: caspase family protein [Hyphomicrobium sp.]
MAAEGLTRGAWRVVRKRLAAAIGCALLAAMLACGPAAAGAAPQTPVAAGAEPRIALIIGNASYATSRLKNPRNDAGLMARTLAAAGFDVMTVMDGTAEDMRRAVADFGSRLQTPGAVALFYYAGHGVQVDGDNYLIPLGATIATTEDVTEFGVPLHSVMRTMARSSTRLNIVVLDACRDNPFAAGVWTATVTGLASVVAPAGTIIAYATGPGQLADDGIGANSPYTAALASEMLQPGKTLEDVFRATRRHVIERTANRQTPWEHSSLVTQFSFVPQASNTVAPETAAQTARLAEMTAWEAIQSSQDVVVLHNHITRYPNGLFAELASVRIAKIEALHTRTPWSWMMTGGIDATERLMAAQATHDKALMLDADGAPAADIALAVKLYTEAAAEGLPAALYRVGRAYDKGRGVSKDLLEAARWYERAADAGYPAAMAALGTMHEFGEGAAPNLVEALRLYRAAADGGDVAGITSLAYLYSQGKGVAKNSAEARRLYRLAADKKHPRAMYNLALMDLAGEGARPNTASALGLLEAAAGYGHAAAYVELARIYDRGRGVARNPARAAETALKAVQAGRTEGRGIDIATQGLSFATRRQIQKQLALQGLYRGTIHGFFNTETRQALQIMAQR